MVLVMREVAIVGVVFLSLAVWAPVLAANHQITKSPNHKIIKVSAERFAFFPTEITVEKGTVIEFHLTSEDTDHGFHIIGTDVDVQIPKRRRGETIVKYTADSAGRFTIECSRPCGAGHTAMRATLIVK